MASSTMEGHFFFFFYHFPSTKKSNVGDGDENSRGQWGRTSSSGSPVNQSLPHVVAECRSQSPPPAFVGPSDLRGGSFLGWQKRTCLELACSLPAVA